MNLRNKFDDDDIRFYKIVAMSAFAVGLAVLVFLQSSWYVKSTDTSFSLYETNTPVQNMTPIGRFSDESIDVTMARAPLGASTTSPIDTYSVVCIFLSNTCKCFFNMIQQSCKK